MKKKSILILVMALAFNYAWSQTTLPYYTGFNNSTDISGWTTYRKGDVSSGNWEYTSIMPYTTPSCSIHYYPVGGTVATDDWFVSPPFNFPAGGKIDSVRSAFSGFSVPSTADTVAIYVLTGSPDPALATSKTLLVDYRGNNYLSDNTWHKMTNITIPPSSGQSYIAFKYTTDISWLDVKFDNLKISGNSSVGIDKNVSKKEAISLFPNPTQNYLTVVNNDVNESLHVKLFNSIGALVLEKDIVSEKQISFDEPTGNYFYQISNSKKEIIKSGKLIITE